jgi:DNA-binding NarL/FixJ family response regulator
MSKIRLLIVDDLDHVRQGMRTLLSLSDDIEIIGEAINGFEAIGMVAVLKPDVALMDLEMPKMDGIEASKWIKQISPATRIMTITIHDTDTFRAHAEAAGVDAFFVKATPSEVLIEKIREIAE